jgi:hypothetical protein
MHVAGEARCEPGADRAAIDHDRLAAIPRRDGIPRGAHVGVELSFAAHAPGALAVPTIVEHEKVEIGAAVELRVDEPARQVAGIAVKKEHHAPGIGQLQVQGRQPRAIDVDADLLDVLHREGVIGRQRNGVKQQHFLAPVDQRDPAQHGQQRANHCNDHVTPHS